jgi:hypothetical protein
VLHTPCPTLHREIGLYLSILERTKPVSREPRPFGPGIRRRQALVATRETTIVS